MAYPSGVGNPVQYDGPHPIPSNNLPTTVPIDDPDHFEGADAVIHFLANVNGQLREYSWTGNCPVWHANNSADGPGVESFNTGGRPLTVTIHVDASTPGWTTWGPTAAA